MIRFLRAAAALVTTVAALSTYAQVCPLPPLPPGTVGIGDGCSTLYTEYVFPEIGIFKGTFTPSCQRHDTCYTSLGTSYGQCDSAFLSDMQSACKSNFNPFYDPNYLPCMVTAQNYYDGVRAYGATVNPLPNFQEGALSRSISLAAQVNADTCGTTPTMTGLYDAGLVAQVNTAFQNAAHRLPTIYEFLKVVNTGDLTVDRTTWNNVTLPQAAATAATSAAPPVISVAYASSFTKATLTASAANAKSYVWKLNGTTTQNAQWSLTWSPPLYDVNLTEVGFVKVVNTANVPNMVVVQQPVVERGTCAPVYHPGGSCL